MRVNITNVIGTAETFKSVAALREALHGLTENEKGDLVATRDPLNASLNVLVEGMSPSAFETLCQLVEINGGSIRLQGIGA